MSWMLCYLHHSVKRYLRTLLISCFALINLPLPWLSKASSRAYPVEPDLTMGGDRQPDDFRGCFKVLPQGLMPSLSSCPNPITNQCRAKVTLWISLWSNIRQRYASLSPETPMYVAFPSSRVSTQLGLRFPPLRAPSTRATGTVDNLRVCGFDDMRHRVS